MRRTVLDSSNNGPRRHGLLRGVIPPPGLSRPDVWWAATRPTGSRHDGPPDLAVEVRSPGTWRRDMGPKPRQYEASGAKELWLVDTPACEVLVFRGTAFASGAELGSGEQLISPLLPGFALSVDDLFADLD